MAVRLERAHAKLLGEGAGLLVVGFGLHDIGGIGVGKDNAKLVQRERWRRSSGNDRLRAIKVLVPTDWLQPARERPGSSGEVPTGSGEDTRHLAATIASLTSGFEAA